MGLFLIPILWLGKGELDIGGDSNRLYFYDPINYLLSNTLYGVSASGFGIENINYLLLPFVGILAILRYLFSPTVLICAFHGFSLSASFYFVYATIKEIIEDNEASSDVSITPAIIGGLLYAFSPALILGWQYVLVTRNQLFLNPLMFYLMLKYFKSSNVKYIYICLLLSFIFSPNFSVIAAPPIFAFYPISLVFLSLYTVLILKKKIVWRHLGLGLMLLLALQFFHLIPQISGLLSKDNSINTTIFSSKGMYDRGLSYFLGIAPNIKASINMLGLPQMADVGRFSWLFIIFPVIIFVATLLNRKKILPLLSIIFVFVLFFSTANITQAGLLLYRKLFDIPGFSIFRNFYGQWQFTYIFYYSLLFGLSLSIVLPYIRKKRLQHLCVLGTLALLVGNAVPFIKGDILHKILWMSNNISPIIRMDPQFEESLNLVRAVPIEGKFITFPLTDPGYQLVSGVNGGAYLGPSTIAYLSGKQDFSGYEEFWDYKNLVLDLIKREDFVTFKKLLGLFNIRYIYYNARADVYDTFPAFPYIHVREYMPSNQAKYREMIEKMKLKLVSNIANKYFIYELDNSDYLPQVYASRQLRLLRQRDIDLLVPLSWNMAVNKSSFYNSFPTLPDSSALYASKELELQVASTYPDYFKNLEDSRLPWGFVSQRLDSLFYPIVVWRESRSLKKVVDFDDAYIERSLLLASKRVNELLKFDRGVALKKNVSSIKTFSKSWIDPSLFHIFTQNEYNYWEVCLVRYMKIMETLMDKVEKPLNSQYSITTNKALVDRMLILHKQRIFDAIRSTKDFSEDEQKYLATLVIEMFDSLYTRLNKQVDDPNRVTYAVRESISGAYDILLEKHLVEASLGDKWEVKIGSSTLPSSVFRSEGNWLVYPNYSVEKSSDLTLELIAKNQANLVQGNQWKLTEDNNKAMTATDTSGDIVKLSFSNGLVWTIPNLMPNAYYVVSLDYDTGGKDFMFHWYEEEKGVKKSQRTTLTKELLSQSMRTYRTVIHTGDYVDVGYLQITKDGANSLVDSLQPDISKNEISIKNLSVIQIPSPKVYIRQTTISSGEYVEPKIVFQRINPTKYQVTMQNIAQPFTLIFAQKYSPKWKLIDIDSGTNTIIVRSAHVLGNVIRIIRNLFHASPVSDNITSVLYQGEVQQEKTQNIFFDDHTFETWGKKQLPETRHFMVNGYANAWSITPEDFGGEREKTFILEFSVQRVFYVSLIISILTFVLCIYLLIKNMVTSQAHHKKL